MTTQLPGLDNSSRRWRRTGLAAAVVGALALSACSSDPGTPSTNPGTGGAGASEVDTLIIANPVKVDTLDPQVASVNESIWLDQNLYSGLVQADPEGKKIVPDLATDWEVSSDALTYTFHLRDAKFSDGSPVLASDVKFSIDRAKAYDGGWGFLITAVKEVSAPDAKTVVVKLSKPHAPLLADLAMYAYSVLPEKLVKAQGDKFFTKPVGSGPFAVSTYAPTSEIDLVRNDNYYGTAPKIKNVKIKIITNDNARVLALQSGDVDVIENPPGNLTKQIEANPKLQVDLFPSTRVDFIQMNTKDKHFSDVRVRQAVQAAADLKQINKLAYSDTGTPATSFMPYKMLYWNDQLPEPTVDLAKAKQLMADAGFPNGFSTNLVTVSGDAAGQAQAVSLKDSLAKIGIDVKIESYELVTAYDKERNGEYGLGERYWTNDIIDPDEVVTFGVVVDAGSNSFNTSWSDPTATKLAKDARSEPDVAKREEMYRQIQKIVYDQVPYLPINYPPFRYASGKWVKGFKASPLGNYNDSLLTLTVDKH
ncbi:ABC transporter substrate-binding protein [Humibacillus sp. DSM 29435]|uniref:ABC transporter substrate-binding protein n=1 Tax=Humibacillus sp. DSM 29435 TaxID=1869167 RepID=UPI0009F1F7F1|nr:ABC transporter substrate-binding protein [Humibacillus sp. DSM 29435]